MAWKRLTTADAEGGKVDVNLDHVIRMIRTKTLTKLIFSNGHTYSVRETPDELEVFIVGASICFLNPLGSGKLRKFAIDVAPHEIDGSTPHEIDGRSGVWKRGQPSFHYCSRG
jgi:hypothetical protein